MTLGGLGRRMQSDFPPLTTSFHFPFVHDVIWRHCWTFQKWLGLFQWTSALGSASSRIIWYCREQEKSSSKLNNNRLHGIYTKSFYCPQSKMVSAPLGHTSCSLHLGPLWNLPQHFVYCWFRLSFLVEAHWRAWCGRKRNRLGDREPGSTSSSTRHTAFWAISSLCVKWEG